jgi:hypothetical protein
VQETAQIFLVKAGEKLSYLLLCDGGGEVDIPCGQAGEGFRIAGEQAVQEGGTASQVAKDEERPIQRLGLVRWEENIVEPETEPVDKGADGPDHVEEYQEDDPFSGEAGGGVFRVEERAAKCAPEQAEVVVHFSVMSFSYKEKAR